MTMHCFLTHPQLPRPVLKTRAGIAQTVQVKLWLNGSGESFEIIRETVKESGTGLVQEMIALPERPEGCPPWKYAITVPAKADKQNAIIFLNGKFRWVWLTDARAQIPWITCTQPAFPEMVKASIATNREPHRLFLQEILDLKARWEAGDKKPEREDPWPPLLRLRWLELLMATEAQSEEPAFQEEGVLQVKVPTDPAALGKTIGEVRKSATVSLAAFTPTEIPLAKRAMENSGLEEKTKKELLDILGKAERWA